MRRSRLARPHPRLRLLETHRVAPLSRPAGKGEPHGCINMRGRGEGGLGEAVGNVYATAIMPGERGSGGPFGSTGS
jgi:hypothetical protein